MKNGFKPQSVATRTELQRKFVRIAESYRKNIFLRGVKVTMSRSVVRAICLKNVHVLQTTNVEILSATVRHDQFYGPIKIIADHVAIWQK